MNLNWVLRLLLRQKVTIAILELVDQDLVALHVDSSKDTIIRYTHYNRLILVIPTIFLL